MHTRLSGENWRILQILYLNRPKTTGSSSLARNLCRKVKVGERGHYLHHRDVLVEHGEGERRGLPGLWVDWGELVHCVWHLREVQGVEQDKKREMETFKVLSWEMHRCCAKLKRWKKERRRLASLQMLYSKIMPGL